MMYFMHHALHVLDAPAHNTLYSSIAHNSNYITMVLSVVCRKEQRKDSKQDRSVWRYIYLQGGGEKSEQSSWWSPHPTLSK